MQQIMARRTPDNPSILNCLEYFTENGFDGMVHAFQILLNESMKLEPSERALTLAVAEMYVQGVSTRRVKKVVEEMCGLEIGSQQVSMAAKLLDEELEAWRNRPLGEYGFIILDARYEKVRYCGQVRSMPLFVAIGVNADGRRSIIGVSVSLSKAEVHWREFLSSLLKRGVSAQVCNRQRMSESLGCLDGRNSAREEYSELTEGGVPVLHAARPLLFEAIQG